MLLSNHTYKPSGLRSQLLRLFVLFKKVKLKRSHCIIVRFKSLLAKYNLKVITMVFTDGPVAPGEGIVFGGPYPGFTAPSNPGESDKKLLVDTHLKVFQEQVIAAQEFNPVLTNCHALKDYFTEEMAEEFFRKALAWQEENNYTVYHETHRKRFLHSPWVTRGFVQKFPNMKVPVNIQFIAFSDKYYPDGG